MPESVPRPPDFGPSRVTLTDLGRPGRGVAFAGPHVVLPPLRVAALCGAAEEMRVRMGFSRESPPRVRSLQHLAPPIIEELESVRFVDTASEWAGVQLAIHPSAHFGCSFNWTKLCPLGPADAWHLDAAPYTAVIFLSEPGRQYAGGELCLYTGDPPQLWESLRRGEAPPDTLVHSVPFGRPGEVFLFQGRALPHSVRPVLTGSMAGLTGVREGRLTLAVGLYSSVDELQWLFPGVEPDDRVVTDCWRIEAKKARLLAAVEQVRREAAWLDDPDAAVQHERVIDAALTRLIGQ